jgi:acyl-homoserine-lactone acylase
MRSTSSLTLALALLAGCHGARTAAPTPGAGGAISPDLARWEQQAARVTIVRDDWGVPHIYGQSDADAVFGMMYAQAEDDFNRIEMNYLTALGRTAEAEGERAVWQDLRARLFVNADTLKRQFRDAPAWMRALGQAWADGLNFYLSTHPATKPKVLTTFEPWMVLSFTEGSIGGDIESISLAGVQAFYGATPSSGAVEREEPEAPVGFAPVEREPSGSNGIAIAPKNTTNKRALLLINPHTSFYFREEAQMVSADGLNAYGAATWGQFFIYQGFNERTGWMHTSSGADVIDEFAETVTPRGAGHVYKHGERERPVHAERVTLQVRTPAGMQSREFTTYRTHHGPVVRQKDGKWIAVALMWDPVKALTQSYQRIKTKNLAEFSQLMDLHTNSSNNTLFADRDGNIAYFHANYVPRRDPSFDWSKPVDGSNPATDHRGVHALAESPNAINPPIGWVYNTNNWPFTAAGPDSPKQSEFPRYMETYTENPRGVHAIRVLQNRTDFTPASLRDAAYDSYLPAFADLIPTLVAAYDSIPRGDERRLSYAVPISVLRSWDYRWSKESVATTLAVFWGEEMWRHSRADAESEDMSVYDYIAKKASPDVKLKALSTVLDTLVAQFGKWQVAWGDVNRFQRRTGDIVQPFSDNDSSIAVGFTSSRWGSLAAFGARPYPGTRKWYGTLGNSFVAVVEFGDSVRARAVMAGGLNSVPTSRHFRDQIQRYSDGALREVYFYRPQLAGHIEREYHPGR